MEYARSKPKKESGKDLKWFKGDLGGEEAEWIERDREKWGGNHEDRLYRNFINLDGLRAIKIWNTPFIYRGSNERCPQQRFSMD